MPASRERLSYIYAEKNGPLKGIIYPPLRVVRAVNIANYRR